MRIWGIEPARMCRQHLLGEHVELHMMVGSLNKGIKMDGYYEGGLIDTDLIVARHDALVIEMETRGMHHKSPLPEFENPHCGFIRGSSEEELFKRCERCKMTTPKLLD